MKSPLGFGRDRLFGVSARSRGMQADGKYDGRHESTTSQASSICRRGVIKTSPIVRNVRQRLVR